MHRLIISSEAKADLDEIWDYIAEDNPEAATRFLSLLLSECQTLAESPFIGRERNDIGREDVRSLPFKNYVILYQVESSTVQILHIFHGKRDYPKLFS